MATPTFISATSGQYVTSAAVSINAPAGAAVGDLLIAFANIEVGATGSLSYPSGWVELEKNEPSSSRPSISIGYFIHNGSASYTFGRVNVNSFVTIAAYRGSSSVGDSGIALYDGTAGTGAATVSISAAGPDSLEVMACAYLSTNSAAITSPSGSTNRVSRTTTPTLNVADISVATGSTTPKSFTMAFDGAKRTAFNLILNGTGGGGSPVVFTGTIPNQSATVGVPFSLDVASYYTGTLTPFTYALATGDLTGTGLSRTGSVISGTPTSAGTISGLSTSATDTGSNVATSNTFSIVVAAGGDTTPPTFTVAPAVSSITQTTATATATISETGNIYYVVVPQAQSTPSVTQVKAGQNASGTAPTDSGSALATTTLSDPFTGIAAGQAYKACFVAEDDESPPNTQAAVTVVNFTAAAATITFISGQLYRLGDGALLANTALDYYRLYNPTTGALVVSKTGLTTDANGRVSFTDAALTAVEYKSDWYSSSGTNSADPVTCMPFASAV